MRTALVTGGGRGIGRGVAKALAAAGFRVILGVRDPIRAEPARAEAQAAGGPGAEVEVAVLDLASQASVRAFAAAFLARGLPLDLLVNNAGMTSRERRLSPEGHELVLATNYLGPFLLTDLLRSALEAAPGARVVNLSSNIHGWWGYRFEDLDGYSWVKAYAVSKLLVLEWTLELAREWAGSPVSVNAIHPGVVRTGIMYTGRWYDLAIKALLAPWFISVEEGAAAVVAVALEPSLEGLSGAYFEGRRRTRPSPRVGASARRRGTSVLEATRALLGLPSPSLQGGPSPGQHRA